MELVVTATRGETVAVTGDARHCQREELATIAGPFDSLRWVGGTPSRTELRLMAGLLGSRGTLLLDCTLTPDTYLDCLLVGFAKPQPGRHARYITTKILASTAAVSLSTPQRSGSRDPKDSLHNNDEFVDEEELLREEDRVRPTSVVANDCGTAEKRRACKNCTCGQAEAETQGQMQTKVDTSIAQSSCGNCYLGDAFRCGGCPYKGLPAFKPGEQVEIPTTFLADDVI